MIARRLLVKAVAASAAALMLCGVSAGTSIADSPTAHIDGVEVAPGMAELTITTSDLPSDLSLYSADIRVTADGAELPARLTPKGRSKAEGSTLAVVMVVDTSGSMASDIAVARRAALAYSRSLPEDVQAGLITFADKPRLVVKPTTNRAALAEALSGMKAAGSTSLYDAVRLGVSTLDSLGKSAQRRLVVLSDGGDTSSTTSLDGATNLLSTKNVVADVVAFRYGSTDTSAVRQLAETEGGRVLTAQDAPQLSAAFTEIARQFTERALVTVDVPREFSGKSVVLTVTVSSDGVSFSASQGVTFPGGLGWWIPWWPDWSWQLWMVAGLTFTTVMLLTLLLFGVGRRDDFGQRVLEQIAQYGPGRKTTDQAQPQEGALARTAVGWTENVLRSRGWEEKVAERLDLAGLTMRPAEWTLLRVCASVVVAGLLILLGINFFLGVLLGGLLGWVGTLLFVSIRISRRRAAFADQLPDVLQLVAGSLQSGFSLSQALDSVVRENTQPAAGEVSRALAETRIGVELESALDRVALRMASDDLKWIVMAIRIQREVGGNLAEVLRTTVTTMRERAQTRRQVRALSAEGRLSAYVLIGLPFAMAAYFMVTRAEYIRPLYTTGLGLLMLAGSVVFMALGSFWMSRLVKVEV